MTPSRPNTRAIGSSAAVRWAKSEASPTVMCASSQITTPAGGCNRGRPAEYEQRPVAHAAHNHPARPAGRGRRQLEREGGGHAAQHGGREQPRDREREQHAARDHRGQQQRAARGAAREKCCAQKDQQREASVARRKRVGQNGDQALARRVNDAAAGHAAGVAAKAHAHARVQNGCERLVYPQVEASKKESRLCDRTDNRIRRSDIWCIIPVRRHLAVVDPRAPQPAPRLRNHLHALLREGLHPAHGIKLHQA